MTHRNKEASAAAETAAKVSAELKVAKLDLVQVRSNLRTTQKRLQGESHKLTAELAETKKTLSAATRASADLRQQCDKAQTHNKALDAELCETKGELEEAQQRLKSLQVELAAAEEKAAKSQVRWCSTYASN